MYGDDWKIQTAQPSFFVGTMRITRLRIENFRSIRNLDIELGDTSVFIGPNNVGKTAILDAVRLVLTRRWGQRGSGFTEARDALAARIEGQGGANRRSCNC